MCLSVCVCVEHISRPLLDRVVAAMQATHQKHMFTLVHLPALLSVSICPSHLLYELSGILLGLPYSNPLVMLLYFEVHVIMKLSQTQLGFSHRRQFKVVECWLPRLRMTVTDIDITMKTKK